MGFGRGKGFSPVIPVVVVTTKGGFLLDETGHIGRNNADWDAVHDAATANYGGEGMTRMYAEARSSFGNDHYYIARGRLRWDTSSLPDDAVIKAATIAIYPYTVYDVGNPTVSIVSGEGLGDNFAVEDYGTLLTATAPMAPAKAIGDLVLKAYNDFVLNAAGLALISKTGYTLFGIRVSFDIDDVVPVYATKRARVEMGGETDTVGKPILTVAYE